jgi:putative colanic acid biosynthesis UDP-glucose lipid carrier transferase
LFSEVSNDQLKELIEFADENNKTIKFIPDTKEILTKNLKLIITIFFPIFAQNCLRRTISKVFQTYFRYLFPISNYRNLSWLTPILILIKLESKESSFFKQGRPGINENEFNCYKFRSMQQKMKRLR